MNISVGHVRCCMAGLVAPSLPSLRHRDVIVVEEVSLSGVARAICEESVKDLPSSERRRGVVHVEKKEFVAF